MPSPGSAPAPPGGGGGGGGLMRGAFARYGIDPLDPGANEQLRKMQSKKEARVNNTQNGLLLYRSTATHVVRGC